MTSSSSVLGKQDFITRRDVHLGALAVVQHAPRPGGQDSRLLWLVAGRVRGGHLRHLHVDGAPLMQAVFSVNNPVLAFNGLTDQSDRDEQQGMMQLYAGAVMAIRNPGGHRVAVIEQPDRALQHLELLSYLAYRLDEAKKVR